MGILADSHPIPQPFPSGREGSFFRFGSPNDMVNSESVVGMKPGDSNVVIWYQVDEFTRTFLAEHFAAHSHIYHGFTGKVSSRTHIYF